MMSNETKKPRLIRGWMNVYESPEWSDYPLYGGCIWPDKDSAIAGRGVESTSPHFIATIFVDSRTATHPDIATRVNVWGEGLNRAFHPIQGRTVDEVIENWERLNLRAVHYGPYTLCPMIVFNADGEELRQVGEKVDPVNGDTSAYREAILADPDIPRLLVLQGL